MNEKTLRALALILSILMLVALAGCAPAAEGPEAAEPPAAEQPTEEPPAGGTDAGGSTAQGEALVQSKCSMCHTLDRVNSVKYDEAKWTETVERMVTNGAVLTAEEKTEIIAYLTARDAQ